MIRNLLSRKENFFDFFEEHAALIVKGANELMSFNVPGQDPHIIFKNIKLVEQEGDRVTHQCVEALHKTFITPFDRIDIHHLITKMDDIIDEIEDVARYVVLYKLQLLSEDGQKLANIIVASAHEVEIAIKEFRKMKNTELMRAQLMKINNLEDEADTVLSLALENLFERENETRSLIKWKEVYEHLESATDACEDVANILEGIILENE